MEHFKKTHVTDEARTELHDILNLTGAEISINNLAAGTGVPFVHSHKANEEIYVILSGKGHAMIDGKDIPLEKGDWIRVSPAAKRQFSASADEAISFACIQTKAGSLDCYTMTDAVIEA